MLRGSVRALVSGGLSAALVGSVIALAAADDQKPADARQKPEQARARVEARPRAEPRRFTIDPLVHEQAGEVFVSPLAGGGKAELSIDPGLQAQVERVFASYQVPYGAFVALEPATGRVLAYVSHSSANPNAGDLVRDPTPPAASVFKVITAAALVDAGLKAEAKACYGGGLSRLTRADLVDDPRRDRACATLSDALGGSVNTVFAKLASRHLDTPTLRRYADAFGFGQKLPFDAALPPSPSEVPSEPLEFARTAAGFWHMHMSPLHGALIAAAVGNGGVMPRATLIDRAFDASGRVVHSHKVEAFRSVLSRATARTVSRMMVKTVSSGTAHSAFFDERGRPYLPGIEVAGKTGSLSAEKPYRAYSWFVGFAPEQNPSIALAALVVNTPKWRIKSSYVAREALREYLIERPARARRARQAAEASGATAAALGEKTRARQ